MTVLLVHLVYFVLLGLVVEAVTGKDLSASIRDRLLDPLGLAHTVFQPDEPTPRDAIGPFSGQCSKTSSLGWRPP